MLPKNQELKQKRYRIVRLIGLNKIGWVYEASDDVLKTNVSLLEISAESDETGSGVAPEAAFAAEAKVLLDVKHDSIVRAHDYFSEAGKHYLTTEFIAEKNLGDLLQKVEAFALPDVLRWATDLLNALNYLHSHPLAIVHGKIKPQNIIVTANGKAKLLPFGTSQKSPLTHRQIIAEQTTDVNLSYAPLEQIWTNLDSTSRKAILKDYDEKSEAILQQPVSAQSDIYALGATLYHLLARRAPIDSLERSIDILEGKNDPLPALRKINADLPAEISDAVQKALEIKRENRFESADGLHQVLAAALATIQPPETVKTVQNQPQNDLAEAEAAKQKQFAAEKLVAAQAEKARQEAETQKLEVEKQRAEAEKREAEQRAAEKREAEAQKQKLEAQKREAENRKREAERQEAEMREAQKRAAEEKKQKAAAEMREAEEKQQKAAAEAREAEKRAAEERKLAAEKEAQQSIAVDADDEEFSLLELDDEESSFKESIAEESSAAQTASASAKLTNDPLAAAFPVSAPLETDKVNSAKEQSTIEFGSFLNEPPKDNKLFKLAGSAVLALVIVAGVVWGAMSLSKSKRVEPTQTVSAETTAPPPTPESSSPAEPTIAAPITEASAETTDASQSAIAVAAPSVKVKTAAGAPLPRPQKQVAQTPKTEAAPKKPVTVDDLINDN